MFGSVVFVPISDWCVLWSCFLLYGFWERLFYCCQSVSSSHLRITNLVVRKQVFRLFGHYFIKCGPIWMQLSPKNSGRRDTSYWLKIRGYQSIYLVKNVKKWGEEPTCKPVTVLLLEFYLIKCNTNSGVINCSSANLLSSEVCLRDLYLEVTDDIFATHCVYSACVRHRPGSSRILVDSPSKK